QEATGAERDQAGGPGPRVLREAVRGAEPEGGEAAEHDPQGGPRQAAQEGAAVLTGRSARGGDAARPYDSNSKRTAPFSSFNRASKGFPAFDRNPLSSGLTPRRNSACGGPAPPRNAARPPPPPIFSPAISSQRANYPPPPPPRHP